VKNDKDDLIQRLADKVAKLQNNLTYREVENIRLEGLLTSDKQK
jgi:hypothetical protein